MAVPRSEETPTRDGHQHGQISRPLPGRAIGRQRAAARPQLGRISWRLRVASRSRKILGHMPWGELTDGRAEPDIPSGLPPDLLPLHGLVARPIVPRRESPHELGGGEQPGEHVRGELGSRVCYAAPRGPPAGAGQIARTRRQRPMRATVCYVKKITHRQMRNESAEVLRRVAAGETILVTNSGQPAAVIGPPPGDLLALLAAQGQLREARSSPSVLPTIKRKRSKHTTAEMVADVRRRW